MSSTCLETDYSLNAEISGAALSALAVLPCGLKVKSTNSPRGFLLEVRLFNIEKKDVEE
jgi:hypothetical protein